MSTPLEIKLYDALKRIASYDSPEKLARRSEKEYGLAPEDAIEMAYDSVLQDAKNAVKGVRIKRVKE